MKSPFIRIIFVTIILAGFQISWINKIYAKSQGIIVTTDKFEYKQGEVIKITLRNELSESIFSHIGSQTPVFFIDRIERKKSGEDWDKLFAQCQYPHCVDDIDGPAEIKSSQSVSFVWDPLIYPDGANKNIQAMAGTYRLLITYQIRKNYLSKNWEWLKVYSNEFVIK
jgi:hypothetical protein